MPPTGRGRGRGRGRTTRSTTRASASHPSQTQDSQHVQESDLSSAPLPSNPHIYLAHAGEPTEAERSAAYRAGIEATSDACDALRQPLNPIHSWRQLWDPSASHLPQHRRAASSTSGAEWRTARLAYPCSCETTGTQSQLTLGNLPVWTHAYTPPIPPPTKRDLPALPPHPEPQQVPRFGANIPDWSDFSVEGDLDRALDELIDFQHEWETATAWRRDKGKGRAQPPSISILPNTRLSSPQRSSSLFDRFLPETFLHDSSVDFRPPSRARRQVERLPRPRPPSPRPPPAITHPAPPSSALSSPAPDESPLPDDYVEDARVRRAWWRNTMRDGCSAFWHSVTRTVYPAPAVRLKRRLQRDDGYRVPRNLARLEHPLHPDVYFYCTHAQVRVYWLIPIHGPVVVPGLEDPVTNPAARPWASRAEFGTKPDDSPRSKPIVVSWTPELLAAFVKERFEPIWREPAQYGALHLAFSGPKPDPYLALQPPLPLEAHSHVPRGARERVPVRIEAGDHMRVYCDAAHALSFRTWLHWCEVNGRRLFDGARFALIGPRAEVLVVA